MFRVRVCSIASLIVLVLAFPNAAVAVPEAVYDNTTTPTTGGWEGVPGLALGFFPFNYYVPDEQMGDQIALAGTNRFVTEFHLLLSSSQRTDLSSLTLTFHDWDAQAGTPGAELWKDAADNVVVDGPTTVPFFPSVLVPDTFVWTASADSMFAGLATYDPPTVGSSGNYFWDLDSNDGLWYALWFESDPIANFGAKVVAVPEPVTMLFLALGGLSVICRRSG